MADEKNEQKQQQKAPKVQAAAVAAPEPQEALKSKKGEPELSYAGDNKAVVNPDLNSQSASIPTGFDDEGQMQSDDFVLGKVYQVSDAALEVKNAEGLNLLLAVEE